jgi:N-formylmaleamate deformylase
MTHNQAWQQRFVADMTRSDGMTSGQVMEELMRADLRPQLKNITVPVLTVGALQNGASSATPAQVQTNCTNLLANAPDWLNQQIRHFLLQKVVGNAQS